MSDKKPAKQPVDWERIEAQYRAGVMSLREIAAAHNDVITEAAIRKRAKRDEWERDLTAKVRAKAEALVRKEQVRSAVRTETPTEREVVTVEAQVLARIELAHRRDVGRARELVIKLLAEVEEQTGQSDVFYGLGELIAEEHEPGDAKAEKLSEAYFKVISLSGRVANLRGLADAMKTLIALERQAFRMDVPAGEGQGEGKQLSDLEIAARLAYFVDLGNQRKAAGQTGEEPAP